MKTLGRQKRIDRATAQLRAVRTELASYCVARGTVANPHAAAKCVTLTRKAEKIAARIETLKRGAA